MEFGTDSKVEMRKMMLHERASSQTPALNDEMAANEEGDISLNMDTDALDGQSYDMDLTKFTSRLQKDIETFRYDIEPSERLSEEDLEQDGADSDDDQDNYLDEGKSTKDTNSER